MLGLSVAAKLRNLQKIPRAEAPGGSGTSVTDRRPGKSSRPVPVQVSPPAFALIVTALPLNAAGLFPHLAIEAAIAVGGADIEAESMMATMMTVKAVMAMAGASGACCSGKCRHCDSRGDKNFLY